MKKIFADSRTLDAHIVEKSLLSHDILMENAASSLEKIVISEIQETVQNLCKTRDNPEDNCVKVLIVCGSGDNGGDGYALSRRLNTKNVIVFCAKQPKSQMCKLQYQRAVSCNVKILDNLDSVKKISGIQLIVDCFLGSGFSGEVSEEAKTIIDYMNEKHCYKIACDIPSGYLVKCNQTVAMGSLKLALFQDKIKDNIGKLSCANLGVSRELFEKDFPCDAYLLERDDLILPHRDVQNVNKGSFGHAVVISGEKLGASIICAQAAFSFGSGLVTLVSDNDLSSKVPYELMTNTQIPKNTTTTAIAIGMGLGSFTDNKEKYQKLDKFIQENPSIRIVLDADFCHYPEISKILESRCTNNTKNSLVITPHPKEFASLLVNCGFEQYSVQEIVENRVELVKAFVQKYPGIVLILKGANSIIAYSEKGLFINNLGKSCLAKGGSGDVLSGLVLALLAQGNNAFESAKQASLAHTIASEKIKSDYGMSPFDLINEVKYLI